MEYLTTTFWIDFIERNGFYLVFLGVGLYFVKQHLARVYARYVEERNLKLAKDPERVEVLNVEAKRVREQQQTQQNQTIAQALEQKRKKQHEKNQQALGKMIKEQGHRLGGTNPLGEMKSGQRHRPGTHGAYSQRRNPCRGGRCG